MKINKKKLENKLPNNPGVYLWMCDKEIVYIGKAKNLKKRVLQYFGLHKNSYMTSKMMSMVNNLEFIITKNERDALILESNLIKKNNPRFNILLIDDKGHRYIRIKRTSNNIDIKLVRKYKKNDGKYFGPFPIGRNTKVILDLLIRIAKFDNGLRIKIRDKSYWDKKYQECIRIMNTTNRKFMNEIRLKMKKLALEQKYELAKEYKDILNAMNFHFIPTNVELNNNINQDVWGIFESNLYIAIFVMFYRNGKLLHIHKVVIEKLLISMEQYINNFYSSNLQPNEIIISKKMGLDYLNFKNVNIIIPQKGIKYNIIKMANQNAQQYFIDTVNKMESINKENKNVRNYLEKLLKIYNINKIVMIDNSETNNKNIVSVIVVYENFQFIKSKYKKLNIDSTSKLGDTQVTLLAIKKFWNSFLKLDIPDLLILDGGKQHVSVIKKWLLKSEIQLNLIGLVKDDNHQTRAIINNSLKEIPIVDKHLMKFLAKLQIEVDRFAKSHHRTRNRITTLEGKLINIPGIGDKTEKKLLFHFKTYSNIYNATISELEEIVTHKIAVSIKKMLGNF